MRLKKLTCARNLIGREGHTSLPSHMVHESHIKCIDLFIFSEFSSFLKQKMLHFGDRKVGVVGCPVHHGQVRDLIF